MTLTLVQAEVIVERVEKSVLYRHGLYFCRECESIQLATVEEKNMIILSLSTNLSPQGTETSRKILEEVLFELLKRFNDIHISKDSTAWSFRIVIV